MSNTLRTVAFLGLLSGILLAIGGAVGGRGGMTIALVIAAVMNLVSWWFSDKIVLAMYRAKEVPIDSAPELHRIVEECAVAAGIPKPRVCLLEGGAPNAFATGRSPEKGVVAVTASLVQIMSREELKGVVAHELGHIKNRDTLIMAVAATLGAAVTHLAHVLQWGMIFGGGRDRDEEGGMSGLAAIATIILAPIAAMLIQSAISRSREFEADAAGARIAGDGHGLASALEKLELARERGVMQLSHADPATAHLFIVNPLSGGGVLSLFSTHPPARERIDRLRRLV